MSRMAICSLLFFSSSVFSAAAPDIFDYGLRCARELGVPLPEINCIDPSATILPVEQNGRAVAAEVEECDKPALLEPGKACVPGSRLIKYSQTVKRGGRTERITTVALCRRMRGKGYALNNTRFNDVGVIQHNETLNKSCWFFMLSEDGRPSDRIPRPYVEGATRKTPEIRNALAYWVSPSRTEATRCTRCHNSGPWLRTPYVSQATNNTVPENPVDTHVTHVEVGSLFRTWNTEAAYLLKINVAAYLASQPEAARRAYTEARERGEVAAVNSCTQCHNIGRSRTRDGQGACDYFAPVAMGLVRAPRFRSPHAEVLPPGLTPEQETAERARRLRLSHWMPPTRTVDRPEDWARYYAPAVAALRSCCADPTQSIVIDGARRQICLPSP